MYRERRPFRIGLPAAASLVVNALLAAALLSLNVGGGGRQAAPPKMTVVSLAAVKGADRGEEEAEATEQSKPEAVATPAASLPQRPVPASRPATIQPPATVAVPLAISPAPAAKVQPAGAAASVQQSALQSAPTRSPAAAAPPPARRGAADGLDVKAPFGNGRSYAARVRSWLYAHKTYPRRARMRREEGVVKVRFTIDRAGMLLEGNIVQGSGNGALDEEAMATLRRASPFPEAPTDVPGERIEFTVPIEFALAA